MSALAPCIVAQGLSGPDTLRLTLAADAQAEVPFALTNEGSAALAWHSRRSRPRAWKRNPESFYLEWMMQ